MNNSMPLVSLALPVRNGLPHLMATIAGLSRQTYQNFELVVQDSCSTDGTVEYLKSLDTFFPIRIVSEPDRSLVEGYSRAVQRCEGDLLTLIACDEALDDNALETYVSWCRQHPDAVFIYGGIRLVDGTGRVIQVYQPKPFKLLDYIRHQEHSCPTMAGVVNLKMIGSKYQPDMTLLSVPDFEAFVRISLRLGEHRFVCKEAITMTARATPDSMTYRPDAMMQFERDKLRVIERVLSGDLHDEFIDYLRKELRFNLFTSFADFLYSISGDTDVSRRYISLASATRPHDRSLQRLARTSRYLKWDNLGECLQQISNVQPVKPPPGAMLLNSINLQSNILINEDWAASGASAAIHDGGLRINTPASAWHYAAMLPIPMQGLDLERTWAWLNVHVRRARGCPMLSLFDQARNEIIGERAAQSEACRFLGRSIHLNEIVRSQPFFLYDAPGDFQLILRQDAFELFGFCEDMLLGWHIDANMSKRLHLKYGEVGDLADKLSGYHCNHMRQATPKHSETRTDDWVTNVEEVKAPQILTQAHSWGCPLADIEEIRLSACPSDRYRKALPNILGAPMLEPISIMYRGESFDRVGYDARHVLPYLADMFVNCPREWNVAWFGANGTLLNLFAETWARLGFKGRILVRTNKISERPLNESVERADAFVFDFGGITGKGRIDQQPIEIREEAANLLASFWAVVDLERHAEREYRRKRRVITVNTMNSYLERLVVDNLAIIRTRISTRLRHGFALSGQNKPEQWLPEMQAGVAGVRFDGGIRTTDRGSGHVMYGPYKALWPGRHRLRIHLEVAPPATANTEAPLVLEVVNRQDFLVRVPLSWPELARREQVIQFDLRDPLATSVEVRLWSSGEAHATVSSVTIERADLGQESA